MDSTPNHSKNPTKKPRRLEQTLDGDGHGVDRISNFPDEILHHILSFVPTKTVAATTFLSTRWKPLFASIPNLRLDLDDYSVKESQFPVFMHSVLNLILRDVKYIDRFHLRCHTKYCNAHLSTWICSALRFDVRDLALGVDDGQFLVFPESFFHCESLVNLKLDGYFFLDVPSSVCLPNLEYLYLDFTRFRDGDSARRLFRGCFMLNTLIMEHCQFENLEVLDISCPLLSVLVINDFISYGKYEVVLDTPSLKMLKYRGIIAAEAYKVKNMSFISVANLVFGYLLGGGVLQRQKNKAMFVAAFSEVRDLCLSGDLVKAIHDFPQLVPTFRNLTKLSLDCICYYGWKAFLHLLEISPSLEVLTFTTGISKHDFFAEFVPRLTDHVPMCFSFHLQEIEFQKFNGGEEELKLVEYFLMNARALEKMKINCNLSSEELLPISEKLLMLPKCSTTCKILLSCEKG